ncbi:MAG: DUF1178 family protein [Rhizobiales bacterium]|nr:DUF1178 family protein [Hyphomicrobiales bacterium]
MIRYALRCPAEHEFEAWFRSSGDFDRQAAAVLLSCPVCGSSEVTKALMAPNLNAKSNTRPEAPSLAHAGEPDAGPVAAPVHAANSPTAWFAGLAPEQREQMLELARRVRAAAEASSEDVGDRFPEEARRIHYEEAEPRGIRGEATLAEARELLEEGIEILPLPILPEDRN